VDGRRRGSVGMDLLRLADLMRRLGAVSALNLDGGGSSTMVVRGRIMNRPSDGSERPISSAVLILDGTDRRERILGPATFGAAEQLTGEKPGAKTASLRRGLPRGQGQVPAGPVRSALYDPASTGGMLDAMDRGLFGGRALPPALRILLREIRASGWTD
jgi:hypothetical protein